MSARGVVRAYRVLLALLPREVREHDGDEMVRTFEAMWARSASAPARLALAARSVLGVVAVALAERSDVLFARGRRRGSLPTSTSGRGGCARRRARR